jgi:hypothetical protein
VRRARVAFVAAAVVSWVGLAGPASALLAGSGPRPVAVAPASTPPAADQAAPSLGGWNISADGNAVDITFDNATGLAGVHPFTEADFPEAESQFSTGPFGSALASVFWPGSAGGNFGSLSGELGFPSQLQALTSQLNDPVRASAQYPAGPTTASYPPGGSSGVAVMQSTAGPGGVTSEGAVSDQSPSAVLQFSTAKGSSSSTASNTAVGQATSDVGGVALLGGLVTIGSVTSTATATSDGTTGSGSASTEVAGVAVLGQATSIGSKGLVIPELPGSLGIAVQPLVQNALSQVVSALGLTVTELPSTQQANGAGYTATSGGLSISIDPPSSAAPLLEQAASVLAPLFPAQAAIIPTLPGLLQGATLTITLGRATATADASPPFTSTFTPPPATGASGPTGNSGGPATPAAPVGTGAASVTSSSGSSTLASSGGATRPALSTAPTPYHPPRPSSFVPAAVVALSRPLGAGIAAAGIAVTLLAGFGLVRLARMLLPSDAGPVCPLGQDRT